MTIVVEVEGLHKAYGSIRAVDGVSFTVEQGEVFGKVGPNGAGMPIETLPESIRKISAFLPLTYAVNLLRGMWFGEAWSAHITDVAVLLAMIVVVGGLASWLFRWD